MYQTFEINNTIKFVEDVNKELPLNRWERYPMSKLINKHNMPLNIGKILQLAGVLKKVSNNKYQRVVQIPNQPHYAVKLLDMSRERTNTQLKEAHEKRTGQSLPEPDLFCNEVTNPDVLTKNKLLKQQKSMLLEKIDLVKIANENDQLEREIEELKAYLNNAG